MRIAVNPKQHRGGLATSLLFVSRRPTGHPAAAKPVLGERKTPSKQEKNFAAGLMHQQCWCWGRDVASAGNVLLRFGFERHRRPGVSSSGAGGTRYEVERDGVRVALWGFGMWLRLSSGEQGYFARYERGVWLLPRLFGVEGVHSAREVEPDLRRPMHGGEVAAARKLAMAAADWCERYERWVAEAEGPEHRERTLNKWKHAVVGPGEMAAAWRRAQSIYGRWYGAWDGRGGVECLVSSPRIAAWSDSLLLKA